MSAEPMPRVGAPSAPPLAELMLACATLDPDAARCERIRRAVAGDPDWPLILDRAWLHGMLPMVHVNLARAAADALPAAIRASLRDGFERNLRWNLRLVAELRGLLSDLESKDVSALPFKGPVLAQQVYGSLALREFGDLDLLVPASAVQRTAAVLEERGFRPHRSLTPAQERTLLRHACSREYVRSADRAIVEVHWALSGSRGGVPLTVDELLEAAESFDLCGFPVRTLHPHHLVLVLASHGARHMWERVEWLCAFAQLTRSDRIDWAETLEMAARRGMRRSVLLGLRLSEMLLDAPFPEAARRALHADPRIESLAATAREHLFSRADPWSFSLGLPFHRFQLAVRERVKDRLRYVMTSFIVPEKEDYAALSLPAALFPLYYVLRPFRLMAGYARRLSSEAAS